MADEPRPGYGQTTRSPDPRAGDVAFLRRLLIALAILTLAWLAYRLTDVLLLVFGAVLVAAILHALADVIARYTPVPRNWGVMTAGVLLLVLLVGIGWIFGAQIRGQIANVAERLPLAVNTFSKELGLGDVYDQLPKALGFGPGSEFLARFASVGTSVLGALADTVLVVVAGVYIAADPHVYRRGFVKLFPVGQHERVEGALNAAGHALKMWLLSQVMAMALIFVLVAGAAWFIGLPSWLALGLIAGLAEFVPLIGSIVGALPAVLIAFTLGTEEVLWTIGAFLAIQQFESNVITPVLQRKVVDLPPATALFAIVVFGILFGPVGLLFAAPLSVVAFVLVKKLYVRETLGEETPVPGEEGRQAGVG